MSSPLIQGAVTALVTPFKDGAIDEECFINLVERQIAAGIHGLVPMGTTGEASTVSPEEHKRVVELCVATAAGRVRVIAGAGSNSTDEAIDYVRHAKEVGADAALVVTPYYNKPNPEGVYQHYKAINDAVQLPVIAYNVPSRTVLDVSNETYARLAKLPNIVGVKDATGKMERAAGQRLDCGPDWIMLSGNDDSGLGYMAHGGHGCITVSANVAPEAVASFYNACMAKDWETALYWQDRLTRLHEAMFLDSSPAPAKFALAHLGLCREELRLPMTPCSDDVKPAILSAMREAGVINWMTKLIAENRRARYDYFLEDAIEAGLMLTGTEVKSLRVGRANIAESYAAVEHGGIFLINADIPPYAGGNRFNHEPRRPRKLLLHAKQIEKLVGRVQRDGLTLIPTKLYWNDRGIAKLEIAIAKGKKAHDKRATEAARDWQRDKARLMRDHG